MPKAHVGVNNNAASAICGGGVKYGERYRSATNAARLLTAYQKMGIAIKFEHASETIVSPGQLNIEQ